MSRGGRRRGAGRKPKTLEELKVAGTFRPSRHAHLLKVVPKPADLPPPTSERPATAPADVLEGLGAPGRAFVEGAWTEFEGWTVAELALLRLAARQVDDEAAATDARGRRLAARTFAALVEQLGLGQERK